MRGTCSSARQAEIISVKMRAMCSRRQRPGLAAIIASITSRSRAG